MTEFHPDFSHRYAALASGVGRLGWSGNLLTKEYGAQVELGSVLTSATLTPDTPIPDEEHPCDRCKMCSLVCPVEMISPKASVQVTVAGVTEAISRKRPNTCCWIGCTVCGFCRSVCSPGREERLANRKLIVNSGTTALMLDREVIEYLCQHVNSADAKGNDPD